MKTLEEQIAHYDPADMQTVEASDSAGVPVYPAIAWAEMHRSGDLVPAEEVERMREDLRQIEAMNPSV
jgi:hypothetical protein